jgi:hypothetical protein
MSDVTAQVSLALSYPEPFASYGASTVAPSRTSDRGHVVKE